MLISEKKPHDNNMVMIVKARPKRNDFLPTLVGRVK